MEAQQFHLKWNNHSLNTLSSFQHLLDTSCLVDVSLTCSTGKIVPAHRIVLAACSDYFYRLFKDLPEKHPVVVFKDASEQILNDLLEFMYRGEVEVDESNLSDFLKFADTLQVKGLSQGDGSNPAWKPKEDRPREASPATRVHPFSSAGSSSPSTPRDSPAPLTIKDPAKLTGPLPEPVASMNKAYHFSSALAGIPSGAKFPNFFPALNSDPADLYNHLASPTLFNALKRKYPVALGQKGLEPDSAMLKMPFLKEYFGKHQVGLPVDLSYPVMKEEDSDDIAEHSLSPDINFDNGGSENEGSRMEMMESNKPRPGVANGGGVRKPQGRGSRLERMIAAEYKILSEYSEAGSGQVPEALPAITPELMKSRRTHSLQLAIGEILHNKASVQSAATKYHIPRETLRRHYQRYLKAMGIQKVETLPSGRSSATPTKTSSIETLAAAAAATAENDGVASAYSSLLDIGQAYGIWNPTDDNSEDGRDLKIVEDDDDDVSDKGIVSLIKEESSQEGSAAPSSPTPGVTTANNNNVASEKSLATSLVVPMETA